VTTRFPVINPENDVVWAEAAAPAASAIAIAVAAFLDGRSALLMVTNVPFLMAWG
jgi:hypothetical protein